MAIDRQQPVDVAGRREVAVSCNFAAEAKPEGLAVQFLGDMSQAGLMGGRGHGSEIAKAVGGEVGLIRRRGQ